MVNFIVMVRVRFKVKDMVMVGTVFRIMEFFYQNSGLMDRNLSVNFATYDSCCQFTSFILRRVTY